MTGIIKTDQLQGAQSSTITIPTGNKISIADSATIGTINATTSLLNLIKSNGTEVRVMNGSEFMGRFQNNDAVKLFFDNSKKFETASTGVNVTGGIGLGGTGAVNILDDYEEGTWTATLTGSTSNPSTAVTQAGIYTKIGNMVYAQFQMSNVNSTGAAGGVRITGLPFAAGGAQATGNVMFYVRFTIGTTSANITPYVQGTRIDFYQSVNQGGWGEIAHNAGAGAYISTSVFYKTNS